MWINFFQFILWLSGSFCVIGAVKLSMLNYLELAKLFGILGVLLFTLGAYLSVIRYIFA